MAETFNTLIERLRLGRLPAYGALHWDGENGELSTSVHFELDRSESVAIVCERAHRFFCQLSQAEQRLLDIEVTIRAGKPVRATLKPLSSDTITTGRLRQLEDALRPP